MFVQVNGVNLFYTVAGQGTPILLLHGNGEDHSIFDVAIRQLAPHYTVYALDSRGHGQSEQTSALGYTDMMRDVAAFIQALRLQNPLLYGFSDGGIIGLLLAMEHPTLLSKLAISGANTQPDGIKGQFTLPIKIAHFFTRSAKLKLMLTQPDISPAQLHRIVTPTLVLAGSRDMIREPHTRAIAQNIPHSTLRILPAETHSSYVVRSTKLVDVMLPFLAEGT